MFVGFASISEPKISVHLKQVYCSLCQIATRADYARCLHCGYIWDFKPSEQALRYAFEEKKQA